MSIDALDRLNAALSGRYRIGSELGEGGMATVYLADDLKHERKVALKVLKPELAAVVGAERFLAEIKTTANLQHPHILPLHDSGEIDGFLYYVMPFIEGETLGDRLEREKQLPVDEAVRIATDVAEALHSAHEQGVIHRDIKPANILLSQGRPLVADFGIALAVSAAGGGRLTETGLSMGTPYYMSPEQASADREPSAASDVYSLGCVLYEMLVGEPPHTGGSAQAVLAKILTNDAPAPTEARSSIPANVDAAIRKALEKLPADRFTGAQEFAKALADPGFRHGEAATRGVGVAGKPWNRLTVGFATTTTFLAVALGWSLLRPDGPESLQRFSLDLEGDPLQGVGISPDGSAVVFVGVEPGGEDQLWLRRLENLTATPLPGTGGQIVNSPNISSSGEVAFVADRQLKVTALGGGGVRTLADDALCCPRWGPDGFIYYRAYGWRLSPDETRIAFNSTVDGNTDVRIKHLPDGPEERITFYEGSDFRPFWTPDGQRVTYFSGPSASDRNVWSRRADGTGEPVLVLDDERPFAQGSWSPDGEWLVLRAGALASAGFGLREILTFRPSVDSAAVPLVATPEFREDEPSLSADGRWLAYTSDENGRMEAFVRPFPNVDSMRVRVSNDGGIAPLWAHDGQELFFLDEDRGLIAAQFDPASGRVLAQETLFTVPVGYPTSPGNNFYDVTSDGERFLMVRPYQGVSDEAEAWRLVLVQNFFEELKRLVPN